jgi:hypothetical protein
LSSCSKFMSSKSVCDVCVAANVQVHTTVIMCTSLGVGIVVEYCLMCLHWIWTWHCAYLSRFELCSLSFGFGDSGFQQRPTLSLCLQVWNLKHFPLLWASTCIMEVQSHWIKSRISKQCPLLVELGFPISSRVSEDPKLILDSRITIL